ncbi:MAG: tRNA lysidine(34) synthetase TilS [Parvularculaceae bacterium]
MTYQKTARERLAQTAEMNFRNEWRAFGAPQRLLLAVSGGSDSMALMHLAAPLRSAGANIRVATIDHGLRPAAYADARFVAAAAATLNIPAAILRWEGDKPASGVQAAARAARYRLLAQEAECWRADAILTAHTADDQAETVLMRMARRSSARGLAGMARETLIADGAGAPQRLLRPLLGWRRAALRVLLASDGFAFIDDPSNDDARFERVRIRARLARMGGGGESANKALLDLASHAASLRGAVERLEAARFAAAQGEFFSDGSVRLAAAALTPTQDAGLVVRLVGAVSGSDYFPDDDAAGAVLGAALKGGRGSLGGAIVERAGRALDIMREPAGVLGRRGERGLAPITLEPGARLLWDRRFIILNPFDTAAQVRAIGAAANRLGSERRAALSAAPGLWRNGALAAFPGDDGAGEHVFLSLAGERFWRRVVRF